MAIRSTGKSIREAREHLGLSQEKFSEGICSAYSLSRIENGSSGVSPSTFQALMARADIYCESSPIFASRKDFDCFYALKHARFYLDAWQLQTAYSELDKVEQLHWAENKYYYQEWLMLHNRLQFRSGCASHEACLISLLDALHITRPNFDISDFRTALLSTTEIEILTLLAQEYLYTNQLDFCLTICSQLYSQLANLHLSYLEKNRLLAEESIVYVKYLIATEDYQSAYKVADAHRHTMVLDVQDSPLLELSFLTGLASYYLGDKDACSLAFKNTFYAAHSTKSCYATICYQHINMLDYSLITEDIEKIKKNTLNKYVQKKTIDTTNFSDGIYDPFSDELYTIGRLIHDFRTEQKLSQLTLCQGLCSKSKLSKIENGVLQPDIFLTEALLQRLGISERVFSFWGNEDEAKIYDLKFKLIHSQKLSQLQIENLLKCFFDLIPNNAPILMQFYLLAKLPLINDDSIKLESLQSALELTLPQFNVSQITSYRLSWAELNALNLITRCYSNSISPYKSLNIFYKLLDYYAVNKPDLILQPYCYTLTLYSFSKSLYIQKRYKEIVDFLSIDTLSIFQYSMKDYGYFLFYYCQALGECSEYTDAKIFGHYSVALQYLYELFSNSQILCQYLKDDFNIDLT